MTVKRQLYVSDTKERYFHLFYSDYKAAAEREQIDARMERMMRYLNSLKGQKVSISEGYKQYFDLEIYEDDGQKKHWSFIRAGMHRRNCSREISLIWGTEVCGCRVMRRHQQRFLLSLWR